MTGEGNVPVKQQPAFCAGCGTRLIADARFCHSCGLPVGGRPSSVQPSAWQRALRWGLPLGAFGALVALSAVQLTREARDDRSGTMLAGAALVGAPDISSMSWEERADRLFNRVMSLSSEGKTDSAAFFGPMALASLEALTPLTAHRRYDMGLVALAIGDVSRASAQADTILAQRPTHLLGLALAARAAAARGEAAASRNFLRRLLAAEPAERERALPEYTDHDPDIRAAVELARRL